MKAQRQGSFIYFAAGALCAFIFAWGLSQSLIRFFGLPLGAFGTAAAALPTVIFFSILRAAARRWRFTAFIAAPLLIFAAVELILRLSDGGIFSCYSELASEFWDMVSRLRFSSISTYMLHGAAGHEDALRLCVYITVFISVFSAVSVGRLRHILLPAAFASFLFFLEWLLGWREIFRELCICGAALLAAAAAGGEPEKRGAGGDRRRGTAVLCILPAAVFLALCVTGFMPDNPDGLKNERAQTLFNDIAAMIVPDQSSRPRGGFELTDFGYNSMLGGPVTLSDEEIMRVSAPGSDVLLRASIKDTYTGYSWEDASDAGQTRFGAFGTGSELDTVFGLNLLDTSVSSLRLSSVMMFSGATLTIEDLYGGTRVIFSGGRPSNISFETESRDVYFNSQGELFSGTRLRAGTVYSVTDSLPNYAAYGFQIGILRFERGLIDKKSSGAVIDPQYKDIRSAYTTMPEGLTFTHNGARLSFTKTDDTPFMRAMSIRDYLYNNYTYTLTPKSVPDGVDFVQWFLDDGEGYCTYFASAMTMLARAEGLPARYVEGYTLSGAESDHGVYSVTGNQAHAWCEIYFEGIGWLPFDATAAYGSSGAVPNFENADNDDLERTATAVPSTTPRASGTPSVSAVPAPDSYSGGSASPSTIFNGIVITFAAVLVIISAGYYLTRYRVKMARIERRHGLRGAIVWYWRDIRRLLPYLHIPAPASDPVSVLAARAQKENIAEIKKHGKTVISERFAEDEATLAAKAYDDVLYGGMEPAQKQLDAIASFHKAADRAVLRERGFAVYIIK